MRRTSAKVDNDVQAQLKRGEGKRRGHALLQAR